MKAQANKHRSEREFSVGDWVYLKMQHYRQLIVRKGKQHKLFAKFYGPFQVLTKIGHVAYKLHMLVVEPVKLLERKSARQHNRIGVFGLIQWINGTEEDATWEDLADLTKRFHAFV
ncbi:hypothetical protein Tco_1058608 [Tanacetum coccineum]|uniref:Tf2-1-like SH3-like domain-containing protein n=1 Tax=Tanacetum coccineum TaxID=301880 RepID=A0ABQ5H9M5_9ASTR